jgi:hypothetical protein
MITGRIDNVGTAAPAVRRAKLDSSATPVGD